MANTAEISVQQEPKHLIGSAFEIDGTFDGTFHIKKCEFEH